MTTFIVSSHGLPSLTHFATKITEIIISKLNVFRFNVLNNITLIFRSMTAILTNPN